MEPMIIKDEKARERIALMGESINESGDNYIVVKKWAGRTKETVRMSLGEAKRKLSFLSGTPNHGIWIQEVLSFGSIK